MQKQSAWSRINQTWRFNLNREKAYGLMDELHAQSIQVIVVPGYAAPPVSKERVAAFLQKPFSGSELITALCAVVHLAR